MHNIFGLKTPFEPLEHRAHLHAFIGCRRSRRSGRPQRSAGTGTLRTRATTTPRPVAVVTSTLVRRPDPLARSAAHPELARARGPVPPALLLEHAFGHPDLLGLAGLVRH